MSVQIYGTLGPSCADAATLARMIGAGMTGIRLNLSHTTLREAKPYLDAVRAAERETGRSIGLLLDMQGPELRVGRLREPMALEEGSRVALGEGGIPLPEEVLRAVTKGQSLLLDDGRLRLRAESADHALVERGGVLRSRKSAALPGVELDGVHSGLHFLLTLPGAGGERAMVAAAAQQGVRLRGLSEYYLARPELCRADTVVAGYSALKEDDVEKVAQALARAWLS